MCLVLPYTTVTGKYKNATDLSKSDSVFLNSNLLLVVILVFNILKRKNVYGMNGGN